MPCQGCSGEHHACCREWDPICLSPDIYIVFTFQTVRPNIHISSSACWWSCLASHPLRPTVTIHQILMLDLSCRGEDEEKTHKIAKSLSGAACRGGYLFVGSDEGPGFERLHNTGAGSYGERETFPLGKFFDLPGHEDDEAD